MDKVANLVKVTLVDIDYGDKEEFLLSSNIFTKEAAEQIEEVLEFFYDYEIADNGKIIENHEWSFDLEKTLDCNRIDACSYHSIFNMLNDMRTKSKDDIVSLANIEEYEYRA